MNANLAVSDLSTTLSLCGGEELVLPEGHPVDLGEALARAARQYPANGTICLDGVGGVRARSYPELWEEASRVLSGLRGLGLMPGQPVIFQLEVNADFIAAFWGCVLGGFVPVPLSIAPTYEQPHSVLSKLRNAWSMLGGPPVLSNEALAPRLRDFAAREGLAGFEVGVMELLRGEPPAAKKHASGPDDLALLLLTSGSTGLPKAVRHTHRSLLAWAASVAQACEFTAQDVSLNWMPLDHVGGIVMFHLRDVIIGCQQVHAPTEPVLQRPLVWLDWIEQYRVTITWAPNFAFGLLNEQAEAVARGRWDLSSLRFILNAGEAIVSRTARRFLSMLSSHGLPATAMRPAWGMSETSSAVTFSQRFTLATTTDDDAFVQVGEPIPGLQIRIVDHDDVPVPAGKIGRLHIRGVSVTSGYHQNPEANLKSYTADGWFITGDLGVVEDGQLSITGREKDVIIINGVNFYSHEIESAVEEVAGVEVSFTAACGLRAPGENTDRVVIFFCPTQAGESHLFGLIKAIRATVAKKEGLTPDFILAVAKGDIPKTAIGKIQRSQLKERFERGEFAAALARGQTDPTASGLFSRAWREAPLTASLPMPTMRALIFADATGLSAGLARALRGAGHACLVVTPGERFAASANGDIQIDPENPADYARLFQGLPFTHLVHAWAYPPQEDNLSAGALAAGQTLGSLSLLRLLRGWPSGGDHLPVRLLVVTSRLQGVSPQEPVDYAKAPLLGLTRTLPHEYTWLKCVHLDLAGVDPAAELAFVQAELTAASTGEAAVRQGQRLVPVLRSINGGTAEGVGFRAGELYVISGGLGGIGRAIALRLAERYQARLVLLGRTPLPARDRWDQATGEAADRIGALRAIEQAGSEVQYEAGELTDPAFVAAALTRATQRWGIPPAGILHLAGEYHEALLVQETDPRFLAALAPKLLGAVALDHAARPYPNCWFVHFSSVLSYFGAYGQGTYTAANASLNGFALHQRQQGRRSCSILWSLWQGVGMGTGEQASNAALASGYLRLTCDRGFELLAQQLSSSHPCVIAGLDATNPSLRKQLDLNDSSATPTNEAGHIGPRNAIEQQLVQLWQDVLGVPRVGVRDNFFELGGRSLLAVRLFTQIDQAFKRKLPLATLYKAATVEALAAILERPVEVSGSYILAIQPRGSRPPFFCIPGGGSDMILFQDLARALGEDQPFFGLQDSELDSTKEGIPDITVVNAATQFIREMRRIQPKGPYYIGGHCFGGVIGFEMAQQLHAQGESVPFLAMIDSMVGEALPSEIVITLGDKIAHHRAQLSGLNWSGKLRYLIGKSTGFRQSREQRREWYTNVARFAPIQRGYPIKPYAGRIAIFKAADSPYYNMHPEHDARLFWRRFAEGGADVFTIPGDHMTLFQAPLVADFAGQLNKCLTMASATSNSGTPAAGHQYR